MKKTENLDNCQTGKAQETPALFVATNLESWETDNPGIYAWDVTYDHLCFRRLDPDYYAWLRHKMGVIKKAVVAGRLSHKSFNELKARFVRVHEWALEHFDKASLQHSVNTLHANSYIPPKPWKQGDWNKPVDREPAPEPGHVYPPDGTFKFTHPVSEEAVAKVDAIRDQALALDWSEVALYQNRGRIKFPSGQDYGLVCFVDGERCIGEVTRQSIEIIHTGPRESSLRFYNPDVDQPWIKRSRKE